MKKTLLFTFALLLVTFIASAQSNTLTFTGSVAEIQELGLGANQGIYALSDGASFTQGGAFIQYNKEIVSGVDDPVSETFSINTDGSAMNATLTFKYRKASASTVSGVVSVDGQSDFAFDLGSTEAEDGGPDVSNIHKFFDYTIDIPISSTATNVTFTLNEYVLNAATTLRFRIYSIKINGAGVLSTNDFNTQSTTIFAYPNPVTNSFQIDSSEKVENVKLYNISGRLVKTFKSNANYDVSDLATGVYITTIKTQLGSKTLRLIKK